MQTAERFVIDGVTPTLANAQHTDRTTARGRASFRPRLPPGFIVDKRQPARDDVLRAHHATHGLSRWLGAALTRASAVVCR